MLQLLLGRLLCMLHSFIHWQEKYKKRAIHTHRATTQYFDDELRLFMAKAQDSGSHFTEMKSEGVRRRCRGNKKRRM
ncbi:hypothetical protein DLR11_01690 [Salmonella enterica subsp. salamae]|nr:hypothetical protein [Salmonella enterica subsp. salamae]EDH0696220.1 hypothetical protein [Salmonella enterica]ECG1477743.1 hypothetical protein [Salmonella enterica subsp. salamae]ECI3450607.1 hypothetical protein [Salmonella enterica subsp. salamae]ECI4078738.1 hypothetical protein [Salmonella enterica subsp. salamae]